MQKLRITRNDLRGSDCLTVGYCEAYWLLYYQNPIGYNAGAYGWNYDAYDFNRDDGKVILTGYRGMTGRNPKTSIKAYDDKAREIIQEWDITHEQKKEAVNALLDEFLTKA